MEVLHLSVKYKIAFRKGKLEIHRQFLFSTAAEHQRSTWITIGIEKLNVSRFVIRTEILNFTSAINFNEGIAYGLMIKCFNSFSSILNKL